MRLSRDEASVVIRIPVNTAYCNPDDPLDVGDGCNTGFTQTFEMRIGASADLVRVTIQVRRSAAPGALWEDPSNSWTVGSIT